MEGNERGKVTLMKDLQSTYDQSYIYILNDFLGRGLQMTCGICQKYITLCYDLIYYITDDNR